MTQATSLLGPNARPVVAIGHGPGVWRSRSIKGILCSFQWLDLRQHGEADNDDNACVPCMVLVRPASMEKAAYVIPQRNAYLWANSTTGGQSIHLTATVFKVLMTLEMERTRQDIRNVFDIILEAVPDLVDMPSEPPGSLDALVKKHTHGIEAVAKINGHTIHREVL